MKTHVVVDWLYVPRYNEVRLTKSGNTRSEESKSSTHALVQLNINSCHCSTTPAAAKRTNTASGGSLKYSKILQKQFMIVKNHVHPKNDLQIFACFIATV